MTAMENVTLKSSTALPSNSNNSTLDPALAWTYGLLLITAINLGSLLGVALNPLSKRRWYKSLLLFLVANAVGVLAGSCFLFLLAGALGLADLEWHKREEYIGKISIVLGSVFCFYNFEQLLKLLLDVISSSKKKRLVMTSCKKETSQSITDGDGSMTLSSSAYSGQNDSLHHRQRAAAQINKSFVDDDKDNSESDATRNNLSVVTLSNGGFSRAMTENVSVADINNVSGYSLDNLDADVPAKVRSGVIQQNTTMKEQEQEQGGNSSSVVVVTAMSINHDDDERSQQCCSNLYAYVGHVQPGIHNFVDGLSIGAAMAKGLPSGLSIALAVLAEELPHELGDFAVLLKAGLTVRRALLLNFLSAISCYVGFIVGFLAGETPSANVYIFALAAGLFLYISLTDLLPELSPDSNNHTDDDSDNYVVDEHQGNQQHNHCNNNSLMTKGDSIKTILVWPRLKHLLIADFGLILGYCSMVILAVYSDEIGVYSISAGNSGEAEDGFPSPATTSNYTSASLTRFEEGINSSTTVL